MTANPLARVKRAQADALDAQAAALRAEAELIEQEVPADLPLPLDRAAQQASVAPTTLRRWIKSGQLRATLGPRRSYRVLLSDVRALLEARPVVPARVAEPTSLDEWDKATTAELRRAGGSR